jgi:hypothetical protein
MQTTTLIVPGTGAKTKLRLFTLYADYPAGIRARRLAGRIADLAGHHCEILTEMWKLDSVVPLGPIREMIAQEAGESDVLVIAISAADQPDPALNQWLNSLLNLKAKRKVPGLLIGLLGDADQRVDGTNRLVEQLGTFAQRAQMSLVRQPGGSPSMDIRWLMGVMERLLDRNRTGLT